MKKGGFLILLLLLSVLLFWSYSNHFNNGFHFDDSHTVVNNLFIRDLKNIPLFFKDPATFSSLPANQSYRPLVTTSLAVDYHFGNGLDPFCFHLSTFVLFLILGLLLFFFFRKILEGQPGDKTLKMLSLFMVFLFLLHPAIAETVNYVIARSDLQSTLFILVAFVMYQYSSFSRKYFLYLIPVVIGTLAKVPAIMFAPLLMLYILLFEKKIPLSALLAKKNRAAIFSAVLIALPSFLMAVVLYVFLQRMETNWNPGGTSRFEYFITQPWVILHYVKTFFLPLWLSADTDWQTFSSIFEWKVIAGFIGCASLVWIAILASRNRTWVPVSFGILWFFVALIPTSSFIPLSEVMNDHRVFFPYIGLVLAAGYTLFLLFRHDRLSPTVLLLTGLVILSAFAYGTHQRNKVWLNDETLWKDVTEKSPGNARGMMNYGLVLMGRADYKEAEDYFRRGLEIWPYYAYLHINLGILESATGRFAEAETSFKNALLYRNDLPETHFYYARFLNEQHRDQEAIAQLREALSLAPAHVNARYLLLKIYFDTEDYDSMRLLAEETLKILPGDVQTTFFLDASNGKKTRLENAEQKTKDDPTPENYLDLSLQYYNAGRYEDCIQACREALKMKPDYALAYNNICSAYNQLKDWDKAVEAGEKAVQLDPENKLAANNLSWAKSQRSK